MKNTSCVFIYCSTQRPAVNPREDHLLPGQGPHLMSARFNGELSVRPTVLAADKYGGRVMANNNGDICCRKCGEPVHFLKLEP